jgi:HK97 family phage portal protein
VSIFTRFADTYRTLKYVNSPEFKEFRTYTQALFTGSGLVTSAYTNTTGEVVSSANAMRLATWFTCLQIRFEAVGMLPFQILKQEGRNKNLAKDHPAYKLLSCRPNPAMTATQFWKVVQLKRDNHGNCYCPIDRDPRGKPMQIGIIDYPDEMEVRAKGYELYYKYRGQDYSSADILHFKGYTTNGKAGLSLAEHHAETVGKLKAIHSFSNRSISTNPGLYASSSATTVMGKVQLDAFQDYWKKMMAGYRDQGQFPVLYNGYDIKTMGINPKDAMYLEQIQATKEDIYGITKVSPSLAKNYNSGNTYNNGEQQNLDFLIWTLQPMLKDIEEECDYKLFTDKERETYSCKFNEKAMMRTDHATQAAWLEKMISTGLYSINDGLAYLDENPIEGGDDHMVQSNNLTPLRLLDQVILQKNTTQKRNGEHVNGIGKVQTTDN